MPHSGSNTPGPPRQHRKRQRNAKPASGESTEKSKKKSRLYHVPDNVQLDPTGNFILPPTPTIHNQKQKRPSRSQSVASNMSGVSFASSTSTSSDNLQSRNIQPTPTTVESNYKVLTNTISTIPFKEKPTLKILGPNRVKIQCTSSDDKKTLHEKLNAQQFQFFSFTERGCKPKVVVLKGFYYTTCDELKDILIKEENLPVTNVSYLFKNESRPIYLVTFEAKKTTLATLNSKKAIQQLIVKWENFDRSNKRLTQCRNCQRYGHSASNCQMKHRCIKCNEDHEPQKCKRLDRTIGKPTCVNCGGEHPANSTSCPSYVSYAEMIQRNRTKNQRQPPSRSYNFQHHSTRVSQIPLAPTPSEWPTTSVQNRLHLHSRTLDSQPNVSFTPSETEASSNELSELMSLSARLRAIPDVKGLLRDFRALVTRLESTQDRNEQLSILFELSVSSNVN